MLILFKLIGNIFINVRNLKVGIYPVGILPGLFYIRFFIVVLILYLTYQFFQYVFHGNNTGYLAYFIGNNSHLYMPALQIAQYILDLFALRNEIGIANQMCNRLVGITAAIVFIRSLA